MNHLFFYFQDVYLDILETLSGVIADIIISSDGSKGTSTLTLSLDKQLVSGNTEQILTIEIYGEQASTVYPIHLTTKVFQFELSDVIRNVNDRASLVEGIYTILLENLQDVLDPTALESNRFEGSDSGLDENVSSGCTPIYLNTLKLYY